MGSKAAPSYKREIRLSGDQGVGIKGAGKD